MDFTVKSKNLEEKESTCNIIGIFESHKLPLTTKKFDKISNGYISSLISQGEIEGKQGQTLLLYHVPNIISKYILLVGCGKENEFDEQKYRLIIRSSINILNRTNALEAICFLTELNIINLNIYWKIRQAVEIIKDNIYSFDLFKTNKDKSYRLLHKITFSVLNKYELNIGNQAIQHGLAISKGIRIAKDLSNMPPNICNALYLASQAKQLATSYHGIISSRIIDKQQMQKLNMHAYLSVGNGSQNEPLMSVIEYKGISNEELSPIVLIGKGLTFDSGGISIKNSENLDEMKYDMCGAAAVYGIMHIAADLKLPLNIIGILASCENMLDGCSYRPGDIITTMSGQTVEILNTDAEGRLVLCDVLTYVERFKPEIVIDIATLTGACVIALGHHISGLISNCDTLAHELINASKQSGDLAWRLPLDGKFQEQLNSNFADMTNVGGRSGGVITAGCFLSRFTKKYNWAHLDIAGTAWCSGKKKGATGRPVALLSQFLLNKAKFNNKE